MKGNVTDIQRFSLNDGDGIRTTVFLKGCNMHCTWCHNPETIAHTNDILFYATNCIGCGKCFSVCPQDAHIIENGQHKLLRDKCIGCGKCVDTCYAEALRFSSKCMTTEEVMAHIVQDTAYYQYSGGGVTLSGGEVFCQKDFAESIVDACCEKGISVAVETNLLHSLGQIMPILQKLDFVMFDIKLMDSQQHKKYTGTDNRMILENARELDKLGIPMIIRTPLIPGITDTDENLQAIAAFTAGLKNCCVYELLNFNPLGDSKYTALDRENPFAKERPLSEERLAHIREILRDYRIKIS